MINTDELLFVVDENNQPLEPKTRGEVNEKGLWARTADAMIVNTKCEILCHKRSMKKDKDPGMWDIISGGHMAPNESFEEGVIKELWEELGIRVSTKDLHKFMIFKSNMTYKFMGLFVVFASADQIANIKLEQDEVDEIKWCTSDELIKIYNEKISNDRRYFGFEIDLINFAMKTYDQSSCI